MIKDKIRKNPIAYFFTKLLILVLFVFVLDFSLGSVLRHYYFKQNNGLLYRSTYALEKMNEDVLILGSSRANHHYITDMFEKKLGQSCYNAGRDGQFIFYHYAVLKATLKRHTPKVVILDFASSDLRNDGRGYDQMASLLPYYKGHPELDSIIQLRGPLEKWKLCSSIYPYNSSIFTIAIGNATFNKKRKEEYKGYVPLYKEWNRPIVTDTIQEPYNIDSVKLDLYESFIKDCVQRNVKLYIINSPTFRKNTYPDPYIVKAKELAQKYQVEFFDYSQDSLFLNNEGKVFSDPTHLNNKGAQQFSTMIIEKIAAKQQEITTGQ